MSYDDNNSVVEGLYQKCRALADAYPDDIDGNCFVDEIQDCRKLVSSQADTFDT